MKEKKLLNRRCLVGLLVIIVVSLFSFNAYSQVLNGDVNGDGVVNINDALLVARYSAGLQPTTLNLNVANVNCDATINIIDALTIAKYAAQLLPNISCTPTPACTGCTYPTPSPTPVITPSPTPTITRTPTNVPTCSPCSVSFDGYATDKDTSLPVAGAYVTLSLSNGVFEPSVSTFTDQNGYYKISGTFCRNGDINIYASKQGYYTSGGISGQVLCGTVMTVNFQLRLSTSPSYTVRPTCSSCAIGLEGTMVDSVTRLPLSDVTMQLDLRDYGRSYFLTTDSAGFFSFNGITTACDYEVIRLLASKPGYRAYNFSTSSVNCGTVLNLQTVSMEPGSYTPTPIPTTPWPCAIVLTGKVTSSLTGKPIAGAIVSSTSTVRTDVNGNYSLVLQAPQAGITRSANDLLNVQAAGYASDAIPVTEFACGGYAIDFSLNSSNSSK